MTDKYNFDLTPLIQSWQPEVEKHTDYNSWTHRKEVFLGNGESPPLIVIPLDRREHPSVSLYCHGGNAETKDIYQVVNSTGQVPHMNANSQLRVEIGIPPGSTRLHLMYLSETGMAQTGGLALPEIIRQQERDISPDRSAEFKLTPNGTLTPDFVGGTIHLDGGGKKTIPSGTGPNLISHVPASTNTECWVTIGFDETGAFDTVASSDFSLGTSSAHDAPEAVADGYLVFVSVKLANGDTTIREGEGYMKYWAAVPTLSTGGGGGGMTSFDIEADSGTPETVEDGDPVTLAGGTGIETSVDAPATVTITLSDTAVAPGSYDLPSITVDAQGRITDADEYTLVEADIPNLNASKITAGQLALARGGTGSDLSGTGPGHLVQASNGAAVTTTLDNRSATAAPTVNDDSGDGYSLGSVWYDLTNDKAYICLDASSGAAVWKEITVSSTPTFSGARVYHNANQAISGSVLLVLAFNSERYDTNSYHDTSTNNSRLTAPSTGYYRITANAQFTATGTSFNLFIRLNGTTNIARGSFPTTLDSPALNVSTDYYLTAGDYVQVTAFVSANMNIASDAQFSPEFMIQFLGV